MDRAKQIWGDGYEEIVSQIINFPLASVGLVG